MTPILSIRTFTNDQYILDKVFYSNFYRLRGFKENEKKPIILDIGAHCGYFTFSAMALGAKRVYAFEPFLPNYKMLLKNVGNEPLGQTVKVITYQAGVHVASINVTFGYPELLNGSYFDFSNIGYDSNPTSVEYCKCSLMPLDTMLTHYVDENVDIMKLSIGYGEIAIIDNSELISSKVSHLCGEISLDINGQEKFKSILGKKGFIDTAFYPVAGEEESNKLLFHSSRTNRKEVFV